jgi:signal transduction histidine kinase
VRQAREHPMIWEIPIIVLSSREDPELKARAFAEGANDYLVKLPDKRELVARIRHHSRSYINQIERDEAFRHLRESQVELASANIELAQARDMAEAGSRSKSEFVSTVSHELRTPLTAIAGALGLIVGGAAGEVPAAMRPMLEIAHRNSLRLAHLIDDLLDMEKLAAGKLRIELKPHPLMPLIEQALTATQEYGKRLNVAFCITERVDALVVNVDGDRLHQVLANFLSNAAKFSPSGGQVEVAVRREGERVRVSVIDHGPGIAEEFRGRIFQKFSQADSSNTRQKGGTGLGLAISKELIERMHGTIGFDSEPGKGSCFFFELPVSGLD